VRALFRLGLLLLYYRQEERTKAVILDPSVWGREGVSETVKVAVAIASEVGDASGVGVGDGGSLVKVAVGGTGVGDGVSGVLL